MSNREARALARKRWAKEGAKERHAERMKARGEDWLRKFAAAGLAARRRRAQERKKQA